MPKSAHDELLRMLLQSKYCKTMKLFAEWEKLQICKSNHFRFGRES